MGWRVVLLPVTILPLLGNPPLAYVFMQNVRLWGQNMYELITWILVYMDLTTTIYTTVLTRSWAVTGHTKASTSKV